MWGLYKYQVEAGTMELIPSPPRPARSPAPAGSRIQASITAKNTRIPSFSHRNIHGGSVGAWSSRGRGRRSFESSFSPSFFFLMGGGGWGLKREETGSRDEQEEQEPRPAVPAVLLAFCPPNQFVFPSVSVFALRLDAVAAAVAFLFSVCSLPSLSG